LKPLLQLKEQLETAKKIVITHHHNPDGDALGSSLGLFHYLSKKGHDVCVVSPNRFPDFISWMPGAEQVLRWDIQEELCQGKLDEADLLFCLDYNIFHRTKDLAPALENFKKERVLIDHHLHPDEASFSYGKSEAGKSSTCEMVYDFIVDMEDAECLDQNIASCLYAGTVTDTGSFKYNSTTAETHAMVAELMKTGIQTAKIQERMLDTKSETDLRLLGYILKDNMEIIPECHAAIISISKEVFEEFDIQPGGTEGIVNYPLGIKNVIFSTFIVEKDGAVKMSLRSQGTLDVSEIARQNFNGGGHKNAAGGKSDENFADTLKTIKKVLVENKKNIEKCYKELHS